MEDINKEISQLQKEIAGLVEQGNAIEKARTEIIVKLSEKNGVLKYLQSKLEVKK
jgi:hypothetical protein